MTAGPLVIIPFSVRLPDIIIFMLIIRFLNLAVQLMFCLKILPDLGKRIQIKKNLIRPLISYGGWTTVSNIISPLMVYADRFFISVLISMAGVAYYTTPFDSINKLLIIPSALVGVLFPAFSTSYANDVNRVIQLYKKSLKFIFISMFPIILLIIAFSYEGLELWLGAEFARNSFRILRWIAIGVYMNSFAQVTFSLIHGAGRPDITAKFHLIQLPFYIITLWLLIKILGLEGVAIAWVLRIALDTGLLLYMTPRLLSAGSFKLYNYLIIFFVSLLILLLICFIASMVLKIIVTFAIFILSLFIIWDIFLTKDEKFLILKLGFLFK